MFSLFPYILTFIHSYISVTNYICWMGGEKEENDGLWMYWTSPPMVGAVWCPSDYLYWEDTVCTVQGEGGGMWGHYTVTTVVLYSLYLMIVELTKSKKKTMMKMLSWHWCSEESHWIGFADHKNGIQRFMFLHSPWLWLWRCQRWWSLFRFFCC